jgi:predicted alpha/beta hydrolase
LVAAQSGYWRLYPSPRKQGWAFLWFVAAPLVIHVYGYFPAKLFGLGENLPAGVISEFGSWCCNPLYIANSADVRQRFAEPRMPMLAYSIDDDVTAPQRAVEGLLALYSNAAIVRRHIKPKDVGVKRLGHFGFFRDSVSESLWPETVEWLSLPQNRKLPEI